MNVGQVSLIRSRCPLRREHLLLRLTQPCLSSLTALSTESPESTGSTEATTRFGSAT